jgi:dTDP-4-dehydrorhamnose 3,5-epimerase-like enzyme
MILNNTIELQSYGDNRGRISIAEIGKEIPFDVKRIYYLTNLSDSKPRGFHAHRELRQLAICIEGSCRMLLDDGVDKSVVAMDSPTLGVLIEPMVWHEMHDFSDGCVFLVLASDIYNEQDYIRDYSEFIDHKGKDSK